MGWGIQVRSRRGWNTEASMLRGQRRDKAVEGPLMWSQHVNA